MNLERSEVRYNSAKLVHEELEKALQGASEGMKPLRTFFDTPRIAEVEEEKEEEKQEGDVSDVVKTESARAE